MELRHLRYFVAVAEELHFRRAAERLGIAQPPLSQQIQALERELGVALFARVGRRVELTQAGQVFLTGARATLAQAQHAVEAARRAARGEIGRLAVGFVGSATYDDFMPGVLRRFHECYPEVELALEEMTTAEQTRRLRAGTLDVGFVRPPVGDETIITHTVRLEPLLAALPAGHPLAGRPAVALSDLAMDPFVLLPRQLGLGFYDQVVSLCRDAGFNPSVAQEAAEMHTIVSLVAAGIGVSLVPASVRSLRRESVTYVPLSGALPPVVMALAFRHDDESPVLRAFRGVVSDTTCAPA